LAAAGLTTPGLGGTKFAIDALAVSIPPLLTVPVVPEDAAKGPLRFAMPASILGVLFAL